MRFLELFRHRDVLMVGVAITDSNRWWPGSGHLKQFVPHCSRETPPSSPLAAPSKMPTRRMPSLIFTAASP